MKRTLAVLLVSIATVFSFAGAHADGAASLSISAENSSVYAKPALSGPTSSQITAVILDALGNPVEGAVVSFSVSSSNEDLPIAYLNARLSEPTFTTGDDGVASIGYTPGAQAGDDTITATVGSLSKSVTIHVIAAQCSIEQVDLCA